MGSMIEINDTLQITKKQGFPVELDIARHLLRPIELSEFDGRVFEFKDKKDIRNYQHPPCRNFLVENTNGKWIYWGLCHILEITHDYKNKTTSGKFKIIYINSPKEIQQAFKLIDQRPEFDYFI
jgi:hypothetical protein